MCHGCLHLLWHTIKTENGKLKIENGKLKTENRKLNAPTSQKLFILQRGIRIACFFHCIFHGFSILIEIYAHIPPVEGWGSQSVLGHGHVFAKKECCKLLVTTLGVARPQCQP